MSDFLQISLDPRDSVNLTLSGYRGFDSNGKIYMRIYSDDRFYLLPGEVLNTLIVPTGLLTDSVASGLLVNPTMIDVPSQATYYKSWKNNSNEKLYLSGYLTQIDIQGYTYENYPFDLHWLRVLEGSSNIYGNDEDVYSYPHNLQGSEVTLVMEPISGKLVRYSLSFPAVTNSGDANYPTYGEPYQLGFYFHLARPGDILSGVINGSDVEFSAAGMTSGYAPASNTGIIFDLSLNDPRDGFQDVPAIYYIYVGYRGAEGAEPLLLKITSDHGNFLRNELPKLETAISTKQISKDDIRKVEEKLIPAGTIARNRLSIGIKDIVTHQNTYIKQGVYVSPNFVSENGIYTFSLRVKEVIPEYADIDPYSTVRYFAEFNSLGWEPISPITRNQEHDSDGNLLPKLLVFDQGDGATFNVKYLNYITSVTSFRIKIVFDITAVKGLVIPPEVKDYRCIIFDKTQLLEL